jgi:CHAT domain-containing protein
MLSSATVAHWAQRSGMLGGYGLAEVNVIHLALHGQRGYRFPGPIGAGFLGRRASVDDGLLRASEIRKLPIRSELVTLYACDAGIGRIEGEEGVSSLIQASLNAGARTVVASLWLAEDTCTKDLMAAFYRQLAQGESKREALRLAKIGMLRQFDGGGPPLYWAGFVLIGDGEAPMVFGGVP